jgi:hypothetical protein
MALNVRVIAAPSRVEGRRAEDLECCRTTECLSVIWNDGQRVKSKGRMAVRYINVFPRIEYKEATEGASDYI